MHVWDGFLQKVHYSALFGEEKDTKSFPRSPEVSGAEYAEKRFEED
jgi:hypothetical protein